MIEIAVPGYRTFRFEHLVLDHNGTLARDGMLLPGVRERLGALAGCLTIHVLTADTFGTAIAELAGLSCELTVLPAERQAEAKRSFVERLGAEVTVSIGNGRNDRLMLQAAALGIVVLQEEGGAIESLLAAHVVCRDVREALDLLVHPLRLVATLRS